MHVLATALDGRLGSAMMQADVRERLPSHLLVVVSKDVAGQIVEEHVIVLVQLLEQVRRHSLPDVSDRASVLAAIDDRQVARFSRTVERQLTHATAEGHQRFIHVLALPEQLCQL